MEADWRDVRLNVCCFYFNHNAASKRNDVLTEPSQMKGEKNLSEVKSFLSLLMHNAFGAIRVLLS